MLTRKLLGCFIINALLLTGVSAALADEDPGMVEASGSNQALRLDPDPGQPAWLDPAKKISVIQNRLYVKKQRFGISILTGPAKSSTYRNTYTLEPRLSYFFSETFALEFFYQQSFNKKNQPFEALEGTNVVPNVLEIKHQIGLQALWLPWYAKINVFDAIIHLDWFLKAGVSQVSLTGLKGRVNQTINPGQEGSISSLGTSLGTGQIIHLSRALQFRWELANLWFRAPERAIDGADTFYSALSLSIGLGVLL